MKDLKDEDLKLAVSVLMDGPDGLWVTLQKLIGYRSINNDPKDENRDVDDCRKAIIGEFKKAFKKAGRGDVEVQDLNDLEYK